MSIQKPPMRNLDRSGNTQANSPTPDAITLADNQPFRLTGKDLTIFIKTNGDISVYFRREGYFIAVPTARKTAQIYRKIELNEIELVSRDEFERIRAGFGHDRIGWIVFEEQKMGLAGIPQKLSQQDTRSTKANTEEK